MMCLAEALLRIPDADTRDELIKDKIGGAQWERHLGAFSSLFVNASTCTLMLTGRLVSVGTGFDWRNSGDLLGRAALPAPVRDGAVCQHRHDRGGRQRVLAVVAG